MSHILDRMNKRLALFVSTDDLSSSAFQSGLIVRAIKTGCPWDLRSLPNERYKNAAFFNGQFTILAKFSRAGEKVGE